MTVIKTHDPTGSADAPGPRESSGTTGAPVAVTRLVVSPESGRPALVDAQAEETTSVVNAERYARFKYGEGKHVGEFAHALAQLCLQRFRLYGRRGQATRPVLVTTSGYGAVAPAAAALLAPFVQSLRDHQIDAHPFRVHRNSVSSRDYATLDLPDRQAALTAEHLSPQVGTSVLRKAMVITIDDVLVTGVHERAMEEALRTAGAPRILHAYLVDASGAAYRPRVEAELNGDIGADATQLLEIASQRDFIPNARFLKAVLRLPSPAFSRLTQALPNSVLAWMRTSARADALSLIPDLAANCAELERSTLRC